MAKKAKKPAWRVPKRRVPKRRATSKPSKDVSIEYPDYLNKTKHKPQSKRTASIFVDEMLAKGGTDWIDILGVARSIRRSTWYDETKEILQKRGLMPTDPEEIAKGLDIVRQRITDRVKADQKREQLEKEKRRQRRSALRTQPTPSGPSCPCADTNRPPKIPS